MSNKKIFTIDSKNKPDFKKLFKKNLESGTSSSVTNVNYDDDDAYNSYWDGLSESLINGFSEEYSGLSVLDLKNFFFPSIGKKKTKQRKSIVDEEKRKIAKAKKVARIEKQRKERERVLEVESYDFTHSNESEWDGDFLEDSSDKKIYFYYDVTDPDRNICFKSLYEFDDFCERNGYEVDEEEVIRLMNRNVSHCCLNPSKEGYIISAEAYGTLWYDCVDDTEVGAEQFAQ